MASPSSVLTLGLGSWGSASDLLTLGYGLSEDVPETTTYVVCVSGTSSLSPYPSVRRSDADPHDPSPSVRTDDGDAT